MFVIDLIVHDSLSHTVLSRPHPMAVQPLAGSRAVVHDVRPRIIDEQKLGRLSSAEEYRAKGSMGAMQRVWEDATDCYSMLHRVLQDVTG